MTDAVQTPAARNPRIMLVAQCRTDAKVLELFAVKDAPEGVLEPLTLRLGAASPRHVADWAHACARAHKGWSDDELVDADEYAAAVVEAVGLPVGGHAPAGGHEPHEDTPEESAAAVPPAPVHNVDKSNPNPRPPSVMRASF